VKYGEIFQIKGARAFNFNDCYDNRLWYAFAGPINPQLVLLVAFVFLSVIGK